MRVSDLIHKLNFNITRMLLCLFTISLIGFGFCLMGLSVWYAYDGKEYQLDNSLSFSVAAIIFSIGVVLAAVSFCGLFGGLRHNLYLTKLFLAAMVLLMIAELLSVSLIYVYKKKIVKNANSIFDGFIHNYVDDDDVRNIVDSIQSNLHCCGITSAHDWEENIYYSCSSISTLGCSVPASCCRKFSMSNIQNNFFCGVGVRNNSTVADAHRLVHMNGCKFEIYSFLERKHNIIITIFIGILIPQFVGLITVISYMFALHWQLVMNEEDTGRQSNYIVRIPRIYSIVGQHLQVSHETSSFKTDKSKNLNLH